MKRMLSMLVAMLSFAVAAYAVVAYALLPLGAVLHPALRDSFAAQSVPIVFLHVFGAAVALLLGPLQFWTGLRRRRPRLHRRLGQLFLLLGVGLGGGCGLVLALHAHGGAMARTGFALLAVLWLFSAAVALQRILGGDAAAHRRWMMRNFTLALASVTLRLLLPALVAAGLAIEVAYSLVAWACWLPQWLALEWHLRRQARTEAGAVRERFRSGGTAARAARRRPGRAAAGSPCGTEGRAPAAPAAILHPCPPRCARSARARPSRPSALRYSATCGWPVSRPTSACG